MHCVNDCHPVTERKGKPSEIGMDGQRSQLWGVELLPTPLDVGVWWGGERKGRGRGVYLWPRLSCLFLGVRAKTASLGISGQDLTSLFEIK